MLHFLLHSFFIIIFCSAVGGDFLGFFPFMRRSEDHQKNQQSFINDIDTNHNNRISLVELKLFIKEIIGGENFDENREIISAAAQSYSQLDSDNDTYLSLNELRIGMQHQEQRLSTVEDFQFYLEHGLHMRLENREKFLSREIKGKDILGVGLIKDNCRVLKDSNGLNITDIVAAKRLCRGFLSYLLQIVPAPVLRPGIRSITPGVNFTASSTVANRVKISWRSLPAVPVADVQWPQECTVEHANVCPDHNHSDSDVHSDQQMLGSSASHNPWEGTCNHTCHVGTGGYKTIASLAVGSTSSKVSTAGNGVPMEYLLRRQTLYTRAYSSDDSENINSGGFGTDSPYVDENVSEEGFATDKWGDIDVADYSYGHSEWEVVWSGSRRTEFVDLNVAANTRYRYELSAWNEGGRSDYLLTTVQTPPLSWGTYVYKLVVAPVLALIELTMEKEQVGSYLIVLNVGVVLGVLLTVNMSAGGVSATIGSGGAAGFASTNTAANMGSTVSETAPRLIDEDSPNAPLFRNRTIGGDHYAHLADGPHHWHSTDMLDSDHCFWCLHEVTVNIVSMRKKLKYNCGHCHRVFCCDCGYKEGSDKKNHRCALCRAAFGNRWLQSQPNKLSSSRPGSRSSSVAPVRPEQSEGRRNSYRSDDNGSPDSSSRSVTTSVTGSDERLYIPRPPTATPDSPSLCRPPLGKASGVSYAATARNGSPSVIARVKKMAGLSSHTSKQE